MAITESLGAVNEIELSSGVVRYRERGDGPPVLFVHGLLVNADLWRKVVPGIAEAGFRCVAPDLPLGSHTTPLSPEADVGPLAVADLIAELIEKLDLREVTVVANDTGGAITQLLLTRRPERIARVVLTNSDCFERFFPPGFAALPVLARVPGFVSVAIAATRIGFLVRLVFASVAYRKVPDEVVNSYLDPARRDRGVRRDLRKFLLGVHRRHTLAAARLFGEVSVPVLLAWAPEDRLFPISLARRLADAFPNVRLVEIPGSRTFVPEDQPEVLRQEMLAVMTS